MCCWSGLAVEVSHWLLTFCWFVWNKSVHHVRYCRALHHLQEEPRKVYWRNSSVCLAQLWWYKHNKHQLSMNFDFLVSQQQAAMIEHGIRIILRYQVTNMNHHQSSTTTNVCPSVRSFVGLFVCLQNPLQPSSFISRLLSFSAQRSCGHQSNALQW